MKTNSNNTGSGNSTAAHNYTDKQLRAIALCEICAECIRTNNPLTRREINLGVEDLVISIQVMSKARGGSMSKYQVRDIMMNLAENWVA